MKGNGYGIREGASHVGILSVIVCRARPLALCALILSSLVLPVAARAISISPARFDFEIAPDESDQGSIRLTNDSKNVETFSLFIENFVASGEEGAQTYIREDIPTGLASWVYTEQPSITLEPGASAMVPFLVRVPEQAEPGGHYATMFFSRHAGTSAGGVGITEQVGVLLLVRVPGDIREQANIESFRMLNGSVISRLPADFELRVRNTGSVHLEPKGSIVIRNMLGRVAARLLANPNRSDILPNSVRKIESQWVKDDRATEGGFWTEAKDEWTNFAIGRYTASVEATYGSQDAPLTGEEIVFWVIPWRLMLAVFGALILFLLLVRGYNALVVRAALKKSRRK